MAGDAGLGGVEASTTVDAGPVEKWLSGFLRGNLKAARLATAPVWSRIRLCDHYYNASAKSKTRSQMDKVDAKIRIPEAAMQTDLVTAIFAENSHQNNEYFRVAPVGNEKQERADVTKQVMVANLSRRDWPREWSRMLFRFVKHPVAGMKLCVEDETETVIERSEIPNDPLLLQQAMSAGLSPVATGGVDPDSDNPESFMFEQTTTRRRLSFYSRAIDFRRIAFGNPNRSCQKQPHIHEFHYLTDEEIRQMNGLVHVDRLPSVGNAKQLYPQDSGFTAKSNAESAASIDTNNPYYEIVESWGRIPWGDAVRNGEFTVDELLAFLEMHNISPSEVFAAKRGGTDTDEIVQKWCVIHTNDADLILQVRPNYLFTKSAYPYDWTSFHELDEDGYSESFTERIGPTCELQQQIVDIGLSNMKTRCHGGAIKTAGSELTSQDLQTLSEPFGIVTLENNIPIEQQIRFMSEIVPDVSDNAMTWGRWVKALNQTYGTPAVLQGDAGSETATQDQMNNARGQQRLNDPFRRAVFDVLVPQMEKLRDLLFRNFNEPQWIEAAGEDGVLMSHSKWVTPRDITNRFKIVPMATFDFSDRNRKGQMLLNLINILSRMGDPAAVLGVVRKMLEKIGFDSTEVADVMGTAGINTDPEQELRVILLNPHEEIKIRPDDNHLMCLRVAQAYQMAYPQIAEQDNFQKYVFFHSQFLQQMQAQMMMGGGGAGAVPPPDADGKRGPQPPPEVPQDGEGEAKQEAQVGSPSDDTINAAGGMTGRAVPFGA